jgi:hypothetical protein
VRITGLPLAVMFNWLHDRQAGQTGSGTRRSNRFVFGSFSVRSWFEFGSFLVRFRFVPWFVLAWTLLYFNNLRWFVHHFCVFCAEFDAEKRGWGEEIEYTLRGDGFEQGGLAAGGHRTSHKKRISDGRIYFHAHGIIEFPAIISKEMG